MVTTAPAAGSGSGPGSLGACHYVRLSYETLRAAADAQAADRACIEVIGADGDLDVRFADLRIVAHIEAAPALAHPGLGPGAERHALARGGRRMDVARNIARRHADVAAARDEAVRGLFPRSGRVPRVRGGGELTPADEAGGGLPVMLRQTRERRLGPGRGGRPQKNQRRQRQPG